MRQALARVVVLILLALVGCREAAETTPNEQPPETLVVGHVGHDHHLALYVAALEGERFAREFGIHLREVKPREIYDLVEGEQAVARLRLVKVSGGSAMPAALSRGEIDVGLGGTPAVAKLADNGQPIRIISPLQTDGDMLVMHPDSPVTDWASFVAAARADGRPLRIGYKAPVAVAKLVSQGALKAEGIAWGYDAAEGNRVVLVNFGSEKSPLPLLERGAIDGFVMNQPGVAVAVHEGLGRVVCELRDLPPEGAWVDHPCCCIAASEETIRSRGPALKAFLKLILLSTDLIHRDEQTAIRCASEWTRYDLAVERMSVPTVRYVAEPTETWLAGMRTWWRMARDMELFTGRYADTTSEEFLEDVCSLTLCREAAAELRAAGLLGAK